MSQLSSTDTQIIALKRKLETAITSRATLEDDFKHQTNLLAQFIAKLSLTTKGIDVLLDNKLAKLRSTLSNSSTFSDVEDLIVEISQILTRHSLHNEQQINQMHESFHSAGKALQKIQGLPNDVRRSLRALLKESENKKDALIQYIPILATLIDYYQTALAAKSDAPVEGLLAQHANNGAAKKVADLEVDQEILSRFSSFLSKLKVSNKHKQKVTKIRSQLNANMPGHQLLNNFLEVFDVIAQDLDQERDTAKVFLSTLSDTLSTVQTAVKTTISHNENNQKQHDKLNRKLKKQINEMAGGLDQANSLADIKVDINDKLKAIAKTLEEKSALEANHKNHLSKQLEEMESQVSKLEEQSKVFEARIKEQQAKSMQDALTKLGNRAAFDEYFAKQIVRYHHQQFDLAIAVLDLDNFKRINDTYGHTAGDKTLQVIAGTLAKQFKDNDNVFTARYGGEEFVLVISNYNKEKLIDSLESLRQKVAKLPFKFKNNKVSITLSIGVSHIKRDDNVHIAFERADSGLYQAKEKGKNTIVYIQ